MAHRVLEFAVSDPATWLTYISPICAVLSAGCALFVAVRGGRWRESDDQKKAREDHLDRTDSCESRLDKLEPRVASIEESVKALPTKADIARLEGMVEAVDRTCEAALEGVKRIESFMMKGGH